MKESRMKHKIILLILLSALMQASQEKTQPKSTQAEQYKTSAATAKLAHCEHLAPHIAPVELQQIVLGYLGWEENQKLNSHADICSILFSPDSNYFATGSTGGSITLWKRDENGCWQEFRNSYWGNNQRLLPGAFSPDGKYFASVSDDNKISLIQYKKLAGYPMLTHPNKITSIGFSPDSHYFASCSKDRISLLKNNNDQWQSFMDLKVFPPMPESFEDILEYEPTSNNTSTVFVRHKGYILRNNCILLYGKASGKKQIVNQNSNLPITAANFTDDGTYFVFALGNESIKLWKLNENDVWQEMQTITLRAKSHHCCELSPDNKYFASITSILGQTIKISEANDHSKMVQTLHGHNSQFKALTFSPNSQYLASASSDKTISLWTKQADELMQPIKEKQKTIPKTIYEHSLYLWKSGLKDVLTGFVTTYVLLRYWIV